jgi:hypothetical protein
MAVPIIGEWRNPMLLCATSPDDELNALAQDVRRVADTIDEPEVRSRLTEIANELLELAHKDAARY